MPPAKPTATGRLGSTPLSNLLIYVLDRRLTGTIVIEDASKAKSAIVVRDGMPTKVKVGASVARLAEVVAELGIVSADAAKEVDAATVSEGKPFGQVLLERGLTDQATLQGALQEQAGRRIEWLAALPPDALYGFYEGQDLLASHGMQQPAALEPLPLVWRAVRAQVDSTAVDVTLAKLRSGDLRLHAQSRPRKFGFDAGEQAVVDVLRAKTQSLASLLSTNLLPEPHIKKIVYALAATRHLDLGSTARPVDARDSSALRKARSDVLEARAKASGASRNVAKSRTGGAALPKKGPRPEPVPRARVASVEEEQAARSELSSAAERIGTHDYYEILGVERDAPNATIRVMFRRLAKKWHPDRLGEGLADLKDQAARVLARVSEAYQVLSDDEQRREYDRLLENVDAADGEEGQRMLRAALAYKRAEGLARKGNLVEAEEQALIAMQTDKANPEYLAFYADILSQKPERQGNGDWGDVIQMANEARRTNPENVKIRFFRARILNRAGDNESAYREYRYVAKHDDHNVEAAREVRLYEMRLAKRTTER